MFRLIVIIVVVSLFSSCMGSKAISFLKHCEEKMNKGNDKFCLINLEELKEELPDKDRIYYLGSDSEYHYFKYHYRTAFYSYDKTAPWAVMGFKISVDEYKPVKKKLYEENRTQKDATTLRVSDL